MSCFWRCFKMGVLVFLKSGIVGPYVSRSDDPNKLFSNNGFVPRPVDIMLVLLQSDKEKRAKDDDNQMGSQQQPAADRRDVGDDGGRHGDQSDGRRVQQQRRQERAESAVQRRPEGEGGQSDGNDGESVDDGRQARGETNGSEDGGVEGNRRRSHAGRRTIIVEEQIGEEHERRHRVQRVAGNGARESDEDRRKSVTKS